MRELYIKEHVFSMRGKFSVKDAEEQDVYFAEGSFLKVPKVYTIKDIENHEVGRIIKEVFTFLPKFTVEVDGLEIAKIKKELTFFKPRYTIEAAGIEVSGDWWGMDFEVYQDGELIGEVNKKWFSWGDSYQVKVLDESMETLMISLVVAIDCVKADQSGAAAATPDF